MTPGETLPPIQLPPEVQAEIENNNSIYENLMKKHRKLRESLGQTEETRNPDLECRFTYHAPKPGQPELYTALREQAKALAYRIVQTVPPGREQASALTHLENAIFWANAGIARHGV